MNNYILELIITHIFLAMPYKRAFDIFLENSRYNYMHFRIPDCDTFCSIPEIGDRIS